MDNNQVAENVLEEVVETPEQAEAVENEESPGTEADLSDQSDEKELSAKSPGNAKAKQTAKKVAEAKKELKKLKIKFNGKEEDLEFDPTDDEYLTKQFQLARLGQSKSQEYSKLEKDIEQFFNILKTNPRAILSDPTIGLDLKKFAAEIIDEEINNAKKSPEQIEKEQLEKELKALKEEQKAKEEQFKAQEFERLQEIAYQQYDQQIHSSLEKASIPKNPYTIKKIADYMLLGLQKGLDVTADDVLPLVREEIQNDIKQMFGAMPDEMVEQLIGKDFITKMRKKSVSKQKQAPVPLNKSIKDVGKAPVKAKDQPKQSYRDFFKL